MYPVDIEHLKHEDIYTKKIIILLRFKKSIEFSFQITRQLNKNH